MRIVGVKLRSEVAEYMRDMNAAGHVTSDLSDKLRDADKASTTTRQSTGKLGGSLRDLAADARRLDLQIDESALGIRDLARQIAATANEAERAKLGDKLGLAQIAQRDRIKLRKLIDFNDNEGVEQGVRYGARFAEGLASGLARAGGPVSSALSGVFGGLPPQAQAAIGAGVVAGVASVGPLVGGAVSGAIVGGIGAGGIVGGIAIAARHPAVKASASETGELFASTLERAGVSFVPATLDALSQVRDGIGDMESDLERASSATSRYLAPLTEDFLSGASRAVEGFANAAERAGPAVDALGEIGRRSGDMLADIFEGLSEHSTEGAHALMALWGVFEYGIRSIAGTIEGLTIAYGWMEKFSAMARGDVAELARLAAEQEAAKTSSVGLADGLQELVEGFTKTGESARSATSDVESLDQMMRRMTSENINAEQANLRLEQAIDRAAEAAREGAGKGIDPHTKAGERNRSVLLGIAEAAQASSAAIMTQTGSHDMAAAASERGRKKFLQTADAMGVERGEARRLADQLFAIPDKVETWVRALTDQATGQLSGFEKRIRQLDGRVITVRTRITSAGEYIPGVGTKTRRWGGITEHARDGLLREAAVYSPQGPARYAFAEPATGGEAFVPKYGDPRRSLDILDRAAGWYGATVQPRYLPNHVVAGGGGGGGATVINNSVMVNVAVPATANKAEVGREIAGALDDWAHKNGVVWRQRKGAA